MKSFPSRLATVMLFIFLFSISLYAQTTAFIYQGRLTDGTTAATGTYEMQFRLFDAASAGAQLGSTVTNNSVTVGNGVFTVTLDFGSSPFTGADRWLEVGVRKASDPPGFTILAPRQQITSSPYSLKTLSATSADSLSAACVGCVTNAQINSVAASKVTGTVANATTAVNVSGIVAVANGGTGATSAANARTNLGLGTLATVSPGGTANNTTFLRGDNTWASIGGSSISFARNGVIANAGNTSYNVPGTGVDVVGVDMSAGTNFTVHLPPATSAGKILVIKIERYNNALLPILTIQPNGTDKIDGANNLAFGNQNGNRRIYSDGAGNWFTW